MGLSLLSHASMPLRFWDEAYLCACYLINRLPSRVIGNMSPMEKNFSTKPDYVSFRTFGCACWPSLRKYNSRKLEFRSKMCVFLGYSPFHKDISVLINPLVASISLEMLSSMKKFFLLRLVRVPICLS